MVLTLNLSARFAIPAHRTHVYLESRSAFNDATESLSPRSTYDRMFFYNELLCRLKETMRKEDVTATDIQKAYEKVGYTLGSLATLSVGT